MLTCTENPDLKQRKGPIRIEDLSEEEFTDLMKSLLRKEYMTSREIEIWFGIGKTKRQLVQKWMRSQIGKTFSWRAIRGTGKTAITNRLSFNRALDLYNRSEK